MRLFLQKSANVCTSEQLSCVKNLSVDYSGCYKKCDGIFITSYEKFDMDTSLNLIVSDLSEQYNNYKMAYKFPSKYKGKLNHVKVREQ